MHLLDTDILVDLLRGYKPAVEWLETLEDIQVARTAYAELKAARGDRKRAGWKKWEEVEGEIQ